jgi:NAD-dependent dihydropyrimidine dehydrogenase PreA subunit
LKRQIIRIDEEKCNGCGLCIPNCPEGALQIVSGKARLVRDLLCDGLGACLGHCPEGAILVEERDAEAYDEASVLENIVLQGKETIEGHLKHLQEHNQPELLRQALRYLEERGIKTDLQMGKSPGPPAPRVFSSCPGSQSASFVPLDLPANDQGVHASKLSHWPIQLHLINPMAPHFSRSNLLLAADCVAYSIGDFHEDHLKGKTLAIGCPKLDDGQEAYVAKLAALIDGAAIHSLTVMIMQVPCCSGLLQLAKKAVERSSRKIPICYQVVGTRGDILQQGSV